VSTADAEPVEFDQLEFIYELKKPVGFRPVLYILGGLFLLGVAGLAFLVGLLVPAENTVFGAFIVSVVLPSLGAIAAFSAAISLIRTPRRVIVAPKGLIVEGERETRRWTWSQIGWASRGTGAIGFRPQLNVFDTRGKKLVSIGPEFGDFDGLADSITSAIAKKHDHTADKVQGKKAKKSAAFLVLAGAAFLALGIVNGINASNEKRAAQRLKNEGVETSATVKRHYLYNVTPRLEYEFTTEDGQPITRDAMVTQAAWSALDGAETVPVRYVPSDPDNNALVSGEVQDEFGSPDTNVLLSIGVGLMAIFFMSIGLMQWFGWDLDLDSKTGKVSIKRFGTGPVKS
jgi:hypothetical protein